MLEGIRKSSVDAEKKALRAYRDTTSQRHSLLGRMASSWKDVRGLMARMQESVARALESTTRIDGYVEEYRSVRDGEETACRALTYSATKLFVVAGVVLAIALALCWVAVIVPLRRALAIQPAAALGGE